jgi:hypothetical protein
MADAGQIKELRKTIRWALYSCGIIDDLTIATSQYVELSSQENKDALSALAGKWDVVKEPMEVFRGQHDNYLNPHDPRGKVISTSTSLKVAMTFAHINNVHGIEENEYGDGFIFSIQVMPGIRYIDVEKTKSRFTSMKNEREIILEGGQDLYISDVVKLTLEDVAFGTGYINFDDDFYVVRCVYAPKGTVLPSLRIQQNQSLYTKSNVEEELKKDPEDNFLKETMQWFNDGKSEFSPDKQVSLKLFTPPKKGGNQTCPPNAIKFIEELEMLQKKGGMRSKTRRRGARKSTRRRMLLQRTQKTHPILH